MTTHTLPRNDDAELTWNDQPDDAVFAAIVRAYQSMVYSIAYHVLHDRGRAEEVAQDVFVRLHRYAHAIKSEKHLVFWLRRVACRRAIDEVRKLPRLAPVSLDDINEPATAADDPDPLLSEGLRRMVVSLPEDARAVIILRYQEELELEEIAEVLNIPVNTVRSRLQRSLEVLREKFSRWTESRRVEG